MAFCTSVPAFACIPPTEKNYISRMPCSQLGLEGLGQRVSYAVATSGVTLRDAAAGRKVRPTCCNVFAKAGATSKGRARRDGFGETALLHDFALPSDYDWGTKGNLESSAVPAASSGGGSGVPWGTDSRPKSTV